MVSLNQILLRLHSTMRLQLVALTLHLSFAPLPLPPIVAGALFISGNGALFISGEGIYCYSNGVARLQRYRRSHLCASVYLSILISSNPPPPLPLLPLSNFSKLPLEKLI